MTTDQEHPCGCKMGLRVVCVHHCGGHAIPGPFTLREAGDTLPFVPAVELPAGWREVERDDHHVLYENDTQFVDIDKRFGVEHGSKIRCRGKITVEEFHLILLHYGSSK